MDILVGHTGFVGSNLNKTNVFDRCFNSKNINDAFESKPDLCIYSGIRAEKFLANKEPQKDKKIIVNAIENIKKINPKKLVLISTIDVYKNPLDVDEDTEIDTNDLHPYGLNRYLLEQWVENNIKDYLIIRLPGLYGDNLKKNFIYDMINFIPNILNESKYNDLNTDKCLDKYYIKLDSGFYKCKEISLLEKAELKAIFNTVGFSALNFTDSRGEFQFYNLSFLLEHINIAIKSDIKKINIATEPAIISELYKHITGKIFINHITQVIPNYNFKTKYSKIFKGKNGYIFDKNFIMDDIKNFVQQQG